MPIYEYKCPNCLKVFEEWVKSHDTGPQACPECGTSSSHIVSNTSFVLKGGGWYVTEYGNRHNPDASATPSPTADSDSGKDTAAVTESAAPKEPAAATSTKKGTSETAAPAAASPDGSSASAA